MVIWDQVIGHDQPIEALRRALARDRAAAGYLFRGPEGVGKRLVARGLAQALRCTAADGERPCGACEECRSVADGWQQEVIVCQPTLTGGSGAARSWLYRMEYIEQLLEQVALRGATGRWRTVIIDGAEFLGERPSTLLLKTLEEPPARTAFILLAARTAIILPTIVSRLQLLDFGLVPAEMIIDWLQTVHGQGAQQARLAAALAAGRPGRALEWCTSEGLQVLRGELLEQVRGLGRLPAAAALAEALWLTPPPTTARRGAADDGLAADDEDEDPTEAVARADRVSWGLDLLEWWYRDALVLAAGGATAQLVQPELATELGVVAAQLGAAGCRDALGALAEARIALARQGNAQLVSEVLFLRLARGRRRLGSPTA